MIQELLTSLKGTLTKVKQSFPNIPASLIMVSAPYRPGLSAELITSEIIRNQEKAGAPVGPSEDGTQSIAEAMEKQRVDAIVKALQEDAKIQVAIAPGEINIIGYGSSPTGEPIIIKGTNATPVWGCGIIS